MRTGFKLPASDPSDPFYQDIEAPDSSVHAWHFAHPNNIYANTFFGGSYVRHPSGLFTLWLDTASRATEETPSRRLHADSIVVQGLKHGELIARYCLEGGAESKRVVGIVADTTPARPRLAWILDPLTLRVTALSADSLTCRTTPPGDGEVDPDE